MGSGKALSRWTAASAVEQQHSILAVLLEPSSWARDFLRGMSLHEVGNRKDMKKSDQHLCMVPIWRHVVILDDFSFPARE